MKFRVLTLLASMVLLSTSAHGHGQLVHFGIFDRAPRWEAMSREMIEAQRSLAVQYARLNVVWSEIERRPGELNFETLDRWMARITATDMPMRPLPTLFVGRGWMTVAGTSPSGIPLDLSNSPDAVYAYSATYYRFVKATVERYREYLDYVFVEYEIDNPAYYDTRADPHGALYARLFLTAHKAIKDVDPGIIAVPAAVTPLLAGTCVAKDWIESGFRSVSETHAMLVEYLSYLQETSAPGTLPPLGSPGELSQYLLSFGGCAPLAAIIGLEQAEAWNFHYLESFRAMDVIASYFQRHDTGSRPVISNEIGCRLRRPDALEEARCAFKNLISAAAIGPLMVWSSGPDLAAVSMFDPTGAERPAARVQRLLATLLGNRFRAVSARRGPEVFQARFAGIITSRSVVDALWSWDDLGHTVEIAENFGYLPDRAVNFLGTPVPLEVDPCRRALVEITRDPLLVFYERPLTPVPTCSRVPTPPSSAAPTISPTRTPRPCTGDCDQNNIVTIAELITGVRIAAGEMTIAACPSFDRSGDSTVTVDELIFAISRALYGCSPTALIARSARPAQSSSRFTMSSRSRWPLASWIVPARGVKDPRARPVLNAPFAEGNRRTRKALH